MTEQARIGGRAPGRPNGAALAAAALCAFIALLLSAVVAHAGGRVIVELQQNKTGDVTSAGTFGAQAVAGTDSATRQAYKFQRERHGKHFTYLFSDLDPSAVYSV